MGNEETKEPINATGPTERTERTEQTSRIIHEVQSTPALTFWKIVRFSLETDPLEWESTVVVTPSCLDKQVEIRIEKKVTAEKR